MSFTIYIYSITDTKVENFSSDCHLDFDKRTRHLHIEKSDGTDVVTYALADSDRLEIRYHAK